MITPWATEEDAQEYFELRMGSEPWDGASPTARSEALTTAQLMLEADGDFEFPDDEVEDNQKIALFEQALFLLRDPVGIEHRQALRAQGVTSAGMLDEQWGGAYKPPIAITARTWLAGYRSGEANKLYRTR